MLISPHCTPDSDDRILWREQDAAAVLQLDIAGERVGRVDTTGAGDAFAAGFLHALLDSGWTLDRPAAPALRRAALAGTHLAAAALRRGRPEVRLG